MGRRRSEVIHPSTHTPPPRQRWCRADSNTHTHQPPRCLVLHQNQVRLLLGEVPERPEFDAPGMRAPLAPYFALTAAVRGGDLAAFRAAAAAHAAAFASDRVTHIVTRLGYNVIRTGLRRINTAYSCISLQACCGTSTELCRRQRQQRPGCISYCPPAAAALSLSHTHLHTHHVHHCHHHPRMLRPSWGCHQRRMLSTLLPRQHVTGALTHC